MDHYSIVQALARAALASPSPAIRRQVERLADALAGAGEAKEATALRELLERPAKTIGMSPARLTTTGNKVAGEPLTRQVPLPVDRETSMPLADLLFPENFPANPPVFEAELGSAIESLIEEWQHEDALRSMGITSAQSCLIYGPPGTGKTRLALWMAGRLGLPVVLARLDGLISSFLGTTARNIGVLFAFAARYNCALLLDEFDAVAKLRDDPQEVGEIKRVVNALLQNLDARRSMGLTIGITNHEGLLDPAIWRRFDTQLAVPRPTQPVRAQILSEYLAPLEIGTGPLRLLAWLTEGATGAELEILARSLKRTKAIAGPDSTDMLATLRRFALLNTERFHPDRRALLFAAPRDLAADVYGNADLDLTQADLSALLGYNRSTISRWLADDTDAEGKPS